MSFRGSVKPIVPLTIPRGSPVVAKSSNDNVTVQRAHGIILQVSLDHSIIYQQWAREISWTVLDSLGPE